MKSIIKIAFVVVFAMVAGYNVYQSQSVMNGMSDFALANVEALARGEGPDWRGYTPDYQNSCCKFIGHPYIYCSGAFGQC
jgi:hypothetical protein